MFFAENLWQTASGYFDMLVHGMHDLISPSSKFYRKILFDETPVSLILLSAIFNNFGKELLLDL